MKILFTGPFRVGSTTESRRAAFVELGLEVQGLDQVPYLDRGPRLFRKPQIHSLLGPNIWAYNKALTKAVEREKPDVTVVDQATYLSPRTVRHIKRHSGLLVHTTSEYFGHQRYWYRRLFRAASLYDLHVITNPLCEPDLRSRGARRIVYTKFGYDSRLHRPIALSLEDQERYGSDAVFVGHWEPSTERMVAALRAGGVRVRVWGPGWSKKSRLADARTIRPAVGEEYVRILNATKIGLCFLSKWNHNTTAGRTFEIPATGHFLLAERTTEHQALYEEGTEAEFFDSEGELVRKAVYYLRQAKERESIALAGRDRSLRSGYTYTDRMRELLRCFE